MSDFDRQDRLYRDRVRRRYDALREAREKGDRPRLTALRRAADLDVPPSPPPRRNRRPALVLAAVFVALVLALVLVARAAGDEPLTWRPSGRAHSGQPAPNLRPFLAGRATPGRLAGEYDRHRIRSIICSVFTGTRCGPAIRVAKCETGGTFYPRALGSAGERGLFQIHPIHFRVFDRRRLFEPRYNARAAFRLSRGGRDWSAWSCQP